MGSSVAPVFEVVPPQQPPQNQFEVVPPKQSISARTAQAPASVPGAQMVASIVQKIKDLQDMTESAKAEHPVLAKVGETLNNLQGFLTGTSHGEAAIGTGQYGMLTNPVTSGVAAAPEEETLNLARDTANLLKKKIAAPFQAARSSEAANAITQTLPREVAAAPVAETRSAATTGGAATTSITNQDVLQHASDMGIKLTPAQALQTSAAKSEQTLGEEALLTGSKIKEAAAVEKGKLADKISEFEDSFDPTRMGLSAEATGEHLQNSAEISRSVLKENVDKIYSDVKAQQADLAGDARPALEELIHGESFARQPHAAVEQPIFQTSAAKAAIKDIQSMLEEPSMQGRQSIQSLRNLRTTLLEKGNDYGANALSSSGQRIYKLAAAKVDSAIMDAAQGTPFEETFRAAGQQNAKLQSLYNDRSSPLYRILNTDDPAKITDGILNRSSVHEIEAMRSEGFDLGPLARQAIEDIKDGGFRVTSGGLGGYPDTFLKSLLGPDATKELYMKADIARRLAENYNPSGSGKVVLGASQVLHPVAAVAAQAARVRSMPKAASSFLDLKVP